MSPDIADAETAVSAGKGIAGTILGGLGVDAAGGNGLDVAQAAISGGVGAVLGAVSDLVKSVTPDQAQGAENVPGWVLDVAMMAAARLPEVMV